MGKIVSLFDGLTNLVSRIGTRSDKAALDTYTAPLAYNQQEIDAAYRTSWFRKIVDAPPFDETRKWRTWQADKEQARKIFDEENRHNIRQKVKRARIMARRDGGSAIFLRVKNSGDNSQPLNFDSVRAGGLEYVTVFSRHEITPGEKDQEALSPFFGQPKFYTLKNSIGGQAQIHPSRVLRFIGNERPEDSDWDGWGDSLWIAVGDYVKKSDLASAGVASLIHEAKLDIISVPELKKNLSTAEYEQILATRFELAARMKSLLNVLLMDGGNADGKGGETFEQKTLNFAGFPDIMDRLDTHMSGMAEIPATRLLGRSPAGMNATGESDMRNYYDYISAGQELNLTPLLYPMDEVLIRSALGARPAEIYYEWNALYQLDEKDAATTEKAFSEAFKIRVETGTIDEAVLAKAEVSRMIESGRYPALEAAIDESDDDGGVKDPDEEEAKEVERMTREAEIAAANQNRRVANDAAPLSLYVRRDVLNRAEIVKWAKAQGFTDIVPDLHVTIAYSRDPVDWFKVGQSWSDKLNIAAGGPRQMDALGPEKNYKALLITASELVWRHKEIIEAGASWEWPEYQPHISIQIGGDIDLARVEPYRGKIVLGPEIFEEVRT